VRLGQGFQFRQRAGLGRGGSGGGRAIGAVEHADQAADPHVDIAVHELGQGLLPEDLLVGGPGGVLHIAGEVLDQAAGRRALDRESGVDVLARTLVGVHPREQEGVADPQALAVHQVVGVAQLLGDGVGGDPHVALGLGQLEEGPQLVRHLVDDDVASLVGDQAPRIDVDADLVAGLGSAGQLSDDLLVGQLVVLGVHLDRLARVRRGHGAVQHVVHLLPDLFTVEALGLVPLEEAGAGAVAQTLDLGHQGLDGGLLQVGVGHVGRHQAQRAEGGSGQGLDGGMSLGQGQRLLDLVGARLEDVDVLQLRANPVVLVSGILQIGMQLLVVLVAGPVQVLELLEVFRRDLVFLGHPVGQLVPGGRGGVPIHTDVLGAVGHGPYQFRVDLPAINLVSPDVEERTDFHVGLSLLGPCSRPGASLS